MLKSNNYTQKSPNSVLNWNIIKSLLIHVILTKKNSLMNTRENLALNDARIWLQIYCIDNRTKKVFNGKYWMGKLLNW